MPSAKPAQKLAPAAPRKRPQAKAKPAAKALPAKPVSGLVGSMRTMAQAMLDVGAAGLATARTLSAASDAARALRQSLCIRLRPQVCLTIMPSRMFATFSQASMACSSRSKMSFQRITTIGSIPFEKSDASASRTMRSPSFSSRLTSIR